jgi:two-component system, cell cycle response regulator DivK
VSKILIVEDDDNNVFVMRTRLSRMGHEVAVAENGEDGVAQARAVRPDLILMDLSLPVMDGWEAMRQLKSAPETAAIPIIVLSAHAMPGVKERALDLGADDFETKPVRMEKLTVKIEKALGLHDLAVMR